MPADGLSRGAAAAAGLLLLMAATAAAATDAARGAARDAVKDASVDAVTTPGSGTLTKCRDWLVYDSCSTYHRIALPRQVAVGDEFKLKYGSNPKVFIFHVVGIRHDGERCTILSGNSAGSEQGEKIEVAPCSAVAKPAADTR